MSKAGVYIPVLVVVIALILLAVVNPKKRSKIFDERVTLKQQDKIPYGMSAARHLMVKLFPHATLHVDNEYPGGWKKINTEDSNSAVVIVADYFDAEENDLMRLQRFTSKGNYVFIISRSFSYDAQEFFRFNNRDFYFDEDVSVDDTLQVKLNKLFDDPTPYTYPGKSYDSYFQRIDTLRTSVLGTNGRNKPNFVRLNKGNGNIFIHSAPLAFSNYFLLYKSNTGYFENAFSVIPADVNKIIWNEYFLQKQPSRNKGEPNWLSIMLKNESFKWAFYTGIGLLLIYVLLAMRRRQRMIPEFVKPKNDSLDYIKTLGKLYYDRRDNKNLADKMVVYFLDHVRNTYKLQTHNLDSEFKESLYLKSGYPSDEIEKILNSIHNFKSSQNLSEDTLSEFHLQLEMFYQNT